MIWRCAVHEAGHAAAYLYLGHPFRTIAIFDDGSGVTEITGRLRDPWAYAIIALAGPAAEAEYMGTSIARVLRGAARTDRENARRALSYLDPAPELHEIIGGAVEVVRVEWEAILRIARELVRRGRLDYRAVARLAA